MKTYTHLFLFFVGLGLALTLPDSARASMGGGGGDTYVAPADPDLVQGKSAIKNKNWDKAVDLLNKAVARDPQNAEIHNLLGFAERNRGNLDAAFKHYETALSLDPRHRGAHEYLGEAYLMAGDLAKAEEQLAALDKLCFFRCEEYSDLKEAITKYKQHHAQK